MKPRDRETTFSIPFCNPYETWDLRIAPNFTMSHLIIYRINVLCLLGSIHRKPFTTYKKTEATFLGAITWD